jgi:hypothetical protein
MFHPQDDEELGIIFSNLVASQPSIQSDLRLYFYQYHLDYFCMRLKKLI